MTGSDWVASETRIRKTYTLGSLTDKNGVIETRCHVFDDKSRWAIRAAVGSGRPLLIQGEPGLGKTQFAEAAALALERQLISVTVDSATETRDLMYTLDVVSRLARAQMAAVGLAGGSNEEVGERKKNVQRELELTNFLQPGPLWWAFAPQAAVECAEQSGSELRLLPPANGKSWPSRVLLIDEIDKAESDVPNALLEALGSQKFSVPGRSGPVEMEGEPPFVVITTNGERALPPAFVRRCVVLSLRVPGRFDREGRNAEFHDWLLSLGRAHFSENRIDRDVLGKIADKLLIDRFQAQRKGSRPLPGLAEFLDLVRAIVSLHPAKAMKDKQFECIDALRPFVFRKWADADNEDESEGSGLNDV